MSGQEKRQELSSHEMAAASGGIGEKKHFMVIKDGEGAFGPFEKEEEAKQKAQELGEGWEVCPVWGF